MPPARRGHFLIWDRTVRKYDKVDEALLAWLRENQEAVTTAGAIAALGISCPTTQRHISRRFTLLEDRGALTCHRQGTTRVCTVHVERLPEYLYRGGPNARTWRQRVRAEVASTPTSVSIPATNSEEFIAAGGQIERLPSFWDVLPPRRQLGPLTLFDRLTEQD